MRGALLLLILASSATEGGAVAARANPVRKVVQMLQAGSRSSRIEVVGRFLGEGEGAF